MYIDDCIKGSTEIMESDIREPLNLGSAEMVSINQLVDIAEGIAGVKLKRKYNLGAPKGVRGRSSDNKLIQKLMGWEPGTKLKDGLAKTYDWIKKEMGA
jgi:nucleoside-diphosphate-sugar epimerase